MVRPLALPIEELPSMALFAAVVQARSFSAAAAQAGLAKSAVSRRIALLEARVGARLLSRTTRKLALTQEGLAFYEHCAALLAAARAATESVSSVATAAAGRLVVNAPVTFAELHLGAPIAAFLARHPAIEIELSTENRPVDLVEGGFDVVIRITRLRESASFVARRLAEDHVVVVAAPDYLACRGRPRAPEELVGHNCLHYAVVERAAEWRFAGAGGGYSVPVRGNFSSSDANLLREVAVAGLGIAIMPSFMVARELADGRLRTILDDQRAARVGIFALYASRKQLPARTRLFVDHLAAWFAGKKVGTK